MSKGVPFDTAIAMSDADIGDDNAALGLAMSVILGQFEGGEFEWSSMSWRKRDG